MSYEEMYAKIEDNKVVAVSSGKGTTGTWIEIEKFQDGRELDYDPSTGKVTVGAKAVKPEISPDQLQPEMDAALLNSLRIERTHKLIETDWTQLPDVPEETREKYKEYRRQLRDITNSYQNVYEVVWPNKPS